VGFLEIDYNDDNSALPKSISSSGMNSVIEMRSSDTAIGSLDILDARWTRVTDRPPSTPNLQEAKPANPLYFYLLLFVCGPQIPEIKIFAGNGRDSTAIRQIPHIQYRNCGICSKSRGRLSEKALTQHG